MKLVSLLFDEHTYFDDLETYMIMLYMHMYLESDLPRGSWVLLFSINIMFGIWI